MAFASIKVRAEDKRAFDRLRHELALRTGEEIPQHELFHRIVEAALAGGALSRPPSRRRSWTRFQFDLGKATDAADELDRAVYGLEP